ncbi:MAG TPA: AtpZ/AtpI family protein [Candidatus Dormibacteraeota bacterium]|nr:AtpZ/AtpI family protein [Candidatus Dormibacteraeota bacterium]
MAPPSNRKLFSSMGLVTGLGFSAVGSLLVGILGGLFLDRVLHTTPLFLIIGILVGIAAAALGIYRLVIREFNR